MDSRMYTARKIWKAQPFPIRESDMKHKGQDHNQGTSSWVRSVHIDCCLSQSCCRFLASFPLPPSRLTHPRCLDGAQEELAAIGVGACIGHGQHPWPCVQELEVLQAGRQAGMQVSNRSTFAMGRLSQMYAFQEHLRRLEQAYSTITNIATT